MRTKNITSILTRAAMLLVLMLTTATSWAQEHSGTTIDGLTWSLSQDARTWKASPPTTAAMPSTPSPTTTT